MKVIAARIRRLEHRKVLTADSRSTQLASILRERRRRRLEAAGEPIDESPQQPWRPGPGKRLSIAETLLLGRQRAFERNRATLSGQPEQVATSFR